MIVAFTNGGIVIDDVRVHSKDRYSQDPLIFHILSMLFIEHSVSTAVGLET